MHYHGEIIMPPVAEELRTEHLTAIGQVLVIHMDKKAQADGN